MTTAIAPAEDIKSRFVSKVVRLASACAGPIVVFGISLKARSTPEKWAIVEQNLLASIACIEKQSDSNFIIAVAGHDKPEFGKYSKNVCWLQAGWEPPTEPTQYSNDKQKKRRLILSGLRQTKLDGFYFFTADADDFIHRHVVRHIRSDDNRKGYYIDKGYIYDASSGVMGLLSPETTPFYKQCGTCAAFWLTRADLPENVSDRSTIWHQLLDHTSFPEITATRGRPITPFPFFAGLYFLNHGASNVQEKGTSVNKASTAAKYRLTSQTAADEVLKAFSVPRPARPAASPKAEVAQASVVVRFSENGRVKHNWGDKLNRNLVEALSKRKVYNGSESKNAPKDSQVYLCIGSSLSTVRSTEIAWGTGYISAEACAAGAPRAICAVRGPMTRGQLLSQGYECPEIYGDPALLFPLFYKPDIEKSYDYGIIAHFKDRDEEVMPTTRSGASFRVIDILGGIEKVVEDILSCKRIVSSSLHGLIAAHAYGVPATWIKFGDRPLGDGFKFQDYWASIGVDNVQPVFSKPGAFCEDLIGPDRPSNPLVDPVLMIESCPFVHPEVKTELLEKLRKEGLGLLAAPELRN